MSDFLIIAILSLAISGCTGNCQVDCTCGKQSTTIQYSNIKKSECSKHESELGSGGFVPCDCSSAWTRDP